MIKDFFYFLKVFFKCRFKFQKPEKAEILLYDQGLLFNQHFIKNFSEVNIEILYTRLEEINLLYYLKVYEDKKSLNKRKFFLNYLITYCNIVKPTWIISSNHFDIKFYDLKSSIDTKVKFAIVQSFPIFNSISKIFLIKI